MKVICILLALLVSGCATKYVAPIDADLAQLRIKAPDFAGWSGIRAVYYKNGNCETPFIFGVVSGVFTTDSDLNMTIAKTENLVEGEYFQKFIEAGEDINMTISGTFANTSCKAPISLSLERDKSYELYYYWSDDKCYVEASEITTTASGVEKRNVAVNKQKNACYSGFSGPAF